MCAAEGGWGLQRVRLWLQNMLQKVRRWQHHAWSRLLLIQTTCCSPSSLSSLLQAVSLSRNSHFTIYSSRSLCLKCLIFYKFWGSSGWKIERRRRSLTRVLEQIARKRLRIISIPMFWMMSILVGYIHDMVDKGFDYIIIYYPFLLSFPNTQHVRSFDKYLENDFLLSRHTNKR